MMNEMERMLLRIFFGSLLEHLDNDRLDFLMNDIKTAIEALDEDSKNES